MCDATEAASEAEAVARRVLCAVQQRPHSVLLLPETADLQAAKAAYHRLTKLLHPDKCAGSTLAADAFRAVITAYKQVQALAAGSATEAEPAGRAADRNRWTEISSCKGRDTSCPAGRGAATGTGGSSLRRQPPGA